jgi:hypothetical protein
MSRICWTIIAISSLGLLIGIVGSGSGDKALGHYATTLIGAAVIGLCILERKG